MEGIPTTQLSAGEQAQLRAGLRHSITELIQVDIDDPAVEAALCAADNGQWGLVPATGIEWAFDEPIATEPGHYSGPQRVTVDAQKPFNGRTASTSAFSEDVALRNNLLTSGDPFAVAEDNGTTTLWQPVKSSTGQWPVFRRFSFPGFLHDQTEIGPADYVIAPHLRLPEPAVASEQQRGTASTRQ
jgi:hypothetical protein